MDKFEEIFSSRDFEFNASREVDDLMRDSRREALQDALSRVDDLDDCWAVFRQSITETIIDDAVIRQVIYDSRMQIGRAIVESEYEKILKMAAEGLIERCRSEVMNEAVNLLFKDPDEAFGIKTAAVALLRQELREEIQQELRNSLRSDPAVIEDVKRELKRQIMGL